MQARRLAKLFVVGVIGWARRGYHNKGAGWLDLAFAAHIKFDRKNFNFTALHNGQKNKTSGRVAEKLDFSQA
jgi:hypothetical protein